MRMKLLAIAGLVLIAVAALLASEPANTLEDALKRGGIEGGWAFLEKNGVPGISPLAYRMGEEVFKTYGAEGLRQCPPRFAPGCRAGVIQSALAGSGLAAIPELSAICDELGPTACVHGFGHGFPRVTNGNLLEALMLCDQYVTRADRPTCWGGAVQEHVATNDRPAERAAHLPLCSSLNEPYRATCAWVFVDKAWSARDHLDRSTISSRCLSLSGSLRRGCLFGVGSLLMQDRRSTAAHMVDECTALFPSPERNDCIVSVANSVPYFKPDEHAEPLCEPLPEPHRALCLKMIGSVAIFDYLE